MREVDRGMETEREVGMEESWNSVLSHTLLCNLSLTQCSANERMTVKHLE